MSDIEIEAVSVVWSARLGLKLTADQVRVMLVDVELSRAWSGDDGAWRRVSDIAESGL